MRCLAVMVDIDRPMVDHVILWQDETQVLAVAYKDVKPTMTRPLAGNLFDEWIAEIRQAFQIEFGRVARIQEWIQVG